MRQAVRMVLIAVVMSVMSSAAWSADDLVLWFPPEWKAETQKAVAITEALSKAAGLTVKPRIANDYSVIFDAFSARTPALVYVGSFAQTLLYARDLAIPLVQGVTGTEMYAGVMVYPQGKDPGAILTGSPTAIAFAIGASSGESSAKAATRGQATIALPNHTAVAGAVKAGKAEAGFVKSWWWDTNKDKFPQLAMYRVPGISEPQHPDNILTASKAVPADVRDKIMQAAMAHADAFGAKNMVPFNTDGFAFSLALMQQGGIDPATYQWK